MRIRPLAAATLATLALAACSPTTSESGLEAAAPPASTPTADAGGTASGDEVRIVRTDDAAALAAEPEVVILDVRTPEEFAEGHLEGAINIDMQAPGAAERFAELDPEGRYLLYCRSGNRSSVVREHLRSEGFRDVADMYGGIISWEDAGMEVVR